MGTELVPRVFGLHLNFFWLRPSMMGWIIINFSILAEHYNLYGKVYNSMLLYQIFTGWYVIDYFYFEEYVTSTWDIIAERFGLMLVWGDLVFIPFTFSIQAWYLLYNPIELTSLEVCISVFLFVLGYSIFRLSNKQKHDFKKNPKGSIWGRPPVLINNKLLASGFWGLASHINYFGDLLLAASFCFPCKFESVYPWFYFIYLCILLVHRDKRDDAKCLKKYGSVWLEYRKQVPYHIIPYIY